MLHADQFDSIVVLTGAGISAESGIKTFRASDGLWEEHRVQDVATPQAFQRDPTLVHRFYNARREQLLGGVEPNPGHFALAAFAQRRPKVLTLVTQNIDDLHERAGNHEVIHMHGELLKVRCCHSDQLFACREAIGVDDLCPCCNEPGALRPHVVWFGEMPLFMDEIHEALSRCDLFVSIGTSGNVYPAAGFFQIAKEAGAVTVEMNLEPSSNASLFDHGIYGPATKTVPPFFTA